MWKTLTSFVWKKGFLTHRLPVLQEAAGESAGVHGPAEERKEKVPSPHLSQLVVLTNSGTLYGLAQRVVATESL